MMILLPEYAINCCSIACSRHLGSGALSSDDGKQVKLYAGKTRRDWGSYVFFFLVNFSPVLYYLKTWNRLQLATKLLRHFPKKRCFELPWERVPPTPPPLTLLGRLLVPTNLKASGTTLNRGSGEGGPLKGISHLFKKEQIKPCSWDVFFPEVSQLILSPIVASYKPWAYTFLKGVLGGLYPRGLKIRGIFFLLIRRWAYINGWEL